jgi:outer membrane protein assembly factor BamA
MRFITWVLLVFGLISAALAGVPMADSTQKEGFVLLPLLYYTPDTRLAAGAAAVYYFRTDTATTEAAAPRLSYVQLLGDYTQNRQLDVWSLWSIFTKGEKYLLRGELRFRNFPDRYYGIGNNSRLEDVERYSYDLISFKLLAMQRFGTNWFAGFDYSMRHQFNFTYLSPGELAEGSVTGAQGGTGSALGLVVTHDSRDNIVNARKGHFFEFSSYINHPILGSTFDFTSLNASYSRYWTINRNQVFAVNAVARANFGEVPFLDLSRVGNDDILRGYAANRFRDLHYIAAQGEWRFPIWGRFGGVAFAGLGDVFASANDWSWQTLKYAVGSGLRFSLNQAEQLNARFDMGYGREGIAFYISVAEAF